MNIPLLSYNQIHKNKNREKKCFFSYLSAIIIPSLYRSFLLRNAELSEKEKRIRLCAAFMHGFFISTYLSLHTNSYFSEKLLYSFINAGYSIEKSMYRADLISSVIIAPIFEEIYKGIGLLNPFIYNQLNEIEDGIIFGADIGNGFATLENIFYGKMMDDCYTSTFLIILRQLTSSALHTYTSALVGEGIAKFRVYCNGNYSSSNISSNLPIIIKYLCQSIIYHAIHNYSSIKASSSKSLISQIVSYCYKIYNLKQKIEKYDQSS